MSHWNKGLAFVALAALAVLPGCAPAPEEPASDAVLLPVPDDATVTFTVWFKVGSQNDPAGKEGLASLTGEMLAGGATTLDAILIGTQELWIDQHLESDPVPHPLAKQSEGINRRQMQVRDSQSTAPVDRQLQGSLPPFAPWQVRNQDGLALAHTSDQQ